MRHGSLFSGIGGFDLAAEWMGWENVFHCEWNEFTQKVLKHYWPDAKSYGDITKTDFSIHRGQIDIITGGFPCQPFSQAGKRKGKDDNRFLWPEMLRAIREIQPGWVVAENVYGIINQGGGMVFEQVQTEMENEGYEVQSYLLPACSVNAPHRRDRFWFVSFNTNYTAGKQKGVFQQEDNLLNGFNSLPSKERLITNSKRFGQSGSGWTKRQISSEANRDWETSWTYSNDKWPTQSPVRGRNDGLSSKLAKQCLEAYGNAIVPQVAFEIFKAIEKIELL